MRRILAALWSLCPDLRDVVFIAGVALLAGGLWAMHPPWALISTGAIFVLKTWDPRPAVTTPRKVRS